MKENFGEIIQGSLEEEKQERQKRAEAEFDFDVDFVSFLSDRRNGSSIYLARNGFKDSAEFLEKFKESEVSGDTESMKLARTIVDNCFGYIGEKLNDDEEDRLQKVKIELLIKEIDSKIESVA